MNHKYFNEKAYIYYMTSNLPIRVFDKNMDLIGQAGVQLPPNVVLDNVEVNKIYLENMHSTNLLEYSSDFSEQYMFIKINKYLKLYALIGPYKYEMPSAKSLDFVFNQLGESSNLLQYYREMPTIKRGSSEQHRQCLSTLFNDYSMPKKPLNDGENMNFDDILMEYREIDFHHHNYLHEVQFFHHFLKGRLSAMDSKHINEMEMAIVSEDYVRSLKNIVIVNIAVMGRYTIERGMSSHLSFSIGDAYIRRLENLKHLQDIVALVEEVLVKYKEALDRVLHINYSKKIKEAIQYIDKNLSIGFALDDVARHVRLHPNYLSTIFKREVGVSFTDYVLNEKIHEAKILLNHSNYTLSEISGILNFSSKSYFIKCFKRLEGITPMKFVELL